MPVAAIAAVASSSAVPLSMVKPMSYDSDTPLKRARVEKMVGEYDHPPR